MPSREARRIRDEMSPAVHAARVNARLEAIPLFTRRQHGRPSQLWRWDRVSLVWSEPAKAGMKRWILTESVTRSE